MTQPKGRYVLDYFDRFLILKGAAGYIQGSTARLIRISGLIWHDPVRKMGTILKVILFRQHDNKCCIRVRGCILAQDLAEVF